LVARWPGDRDVGLVLKVAISPTPITSAPGLVSDRACELR
jgi:hypothetical protein